MVKDLVYVGGSGTGRLGVWSLLYEENNARYL